MKRDNLTHELPGLKRPPGRQATGKAMSSRERVAAYRARLKAIPQAVYDAAWRDVVQAVLVNPEISADQAKRVYMDHVHQARLVVANPSSTLQTPRNPSCSASTTATKSPSGNK